MIEQQVQLEQAVPGDIVTGGAGVHEADKKAFEYQIIAMTVFVLKRKHVNKITYGSVFLYLFVELVNISKVIL